MKTKLEQVPAKNPNPVLNAAKEGIVLYSNEAGERLLHEWGVKVGDKLPSHIEIFIQRVIFRNSPEKMEVKIGKRVYLVTFYPSSGECVNIYGFDISDQKELEEKLRIKGKQNDVLHKVGKIALEHKSLQTFLDESIKLIASILELEYCKIMELLPDGRFLLRAGIGWNPEFVGKNIVGGETESQAGYTLLSRMPVIVEDFEEENRFTKPEILKIHGVVSGASVLIGNMEKVFGVLIVNSTKKRKFTSDDTYFLNSVAFLIAQEVERKKAEEALRDGEERLRFALETSHIGAWDLDLMDHTSYRSLEHDRIFGYEQLLSQWTYEMFLDHVLPEDRAIVDTRFREATAALSDWSFECRIRRVDGEVRWIWAAGHHRLDVTGSVRRMAGIVQDITERKKAEEAIRFSNIYNRSLIEASLDPLVTIGPDGKITDVNGATEQVTGYSRSELNGTDFSDYFTEPEKAFTGYQQVFTHGEVRDYPLEIQHKDGRKTPVLYNASVYKDEAGKVIGVFAAARDITERKKAEKALRKAHDILEIKVKERTDELEEAYKSLKKSEKGLAEAQKMAHLGNWDWNIVTNKLHWSEEIYHIFRCSPQEFGATYDSFLNYVHPDDQEYVDNAVKEALNGKPYSIDHRIVLANGEERIVHEQGEVIFEEKTIPIRMRGTVQDITERKKSEEEIQNLANIVEASNDAIGTISLEGIITSWNKGAEQVYGYSAKEILGKPASTVAPSLLSEETKKLSELVKQGEMIHQHETLRLRKDGKLISVSITLSPIFDIYGKLIAISFISRDITKRKETENALANIEIARKKEIHHRIKNNLQVISSLLDLQAEKFRDGEYVKNSEVLGAFEESQDRVMSIALIHEELHEGKGTDTLNFSPYLERLVKNLFQTYRLGNASTSLKIELEENIFFDMDIAVPLGIIINELVSNSLKYAFPANEKGEIQIKLCREESAEYTNNILGSKKEGFKGPNYVLSVSDNGVGMPEDFNSENPDTLGIQLVMILVDQLGGELEIKRDNGTEFTIKFMVTEIDNQIESKK